MSTKKTLPKLAFEGGVREKSLLGRTIKKAKDLLFYAPFQHTFNFNSENVA